MFIKKKEKKIRFIRKTIYNRSLIITKEDIGKSFRIHQGKKFFNLDITEDIVGYKFGEFSYSRRLNKFRGGKKNK